MKGELKPTEIHIKEDGAIDNTPSFCFILENMVNGSKFCAQISYGMLKSGLDSAERIIKKQNHYGKKKNS